MAPKAATRGKKSASSEEERALVSAQYDLVSAQYNQEDSPDDALEAICRIRGIRGLGEEHPVPLDNSSDVSLET